MNEKSKRKYSKYLIGYAFEVLSYSINTYLVIKKDKIEFILYKWYDYGSPKRKDEIIESLKQEGFKTVEDFKNNKLIKKLR